MELDLNITDGKVDLQNLLSQIPGGNLMQELKERNPFDKPYTANEIGTMTENHFRILMCKALGIPELSEDTELMQHFREKCNIKRDRIQLTAS